MNFCGLTLGCDEEWGPCDDCDTTRLNPSHIVSDISQYIYQLPECLSSCLFRIIWTGLISVVRRIETTQKTCPPRQADYRHIINKTSALDLRNYTVSIGDMKSTSSWPVACLIGLFLVTCFHSILTFRQIPIRFVPHSIVLNISYKIAYGPNSAGLNLIRDQGKRAGLGRCIGHSCIAIYHPGSYRPLSFSFWNIHTHL